MSTPTYRKKLIEVDLPLDAINRESAREKSIRHGHPSTLHLWWARRPLAACRAVIFSSMVDDPSSCPEEFPTIEDQDLERQRLHKLIERLVVWENSNNEGVLAEARREVAVSVARSRGETAPESQSEILEYLRDHAPTVYDPFCGGGSIPLEAQRLGLKAVGSDLNPVAVLITKAMIELPPKFANQPPVNPDADRMGMSSGKGRNRKRTPWRGTHGLADDVRYYGRWMREKAFERIGKYYPKATLPDGSKATVIAWLWARNVPCPNPACGIRMPLMKTFQLSKKANNQHWVRPIIDRENKTIEFQVQNHDSDVPKSATVGRNGATCIACNTTVKLEYVRSEARAGRMGEQMTAIVAEGDRKRIFLPPDHEHTQIAGQAHASWKPSGNLPGKALGIAIRNYGFFNWHQLFTERQLLALSTFIDLVMETQNQIMKDSASYEYTETICTYLALATSKCPNYGCSFASWSTSRETIRSLFARHAIPIVWDYAELNYFSGSTGNWTSHLEWVAQAIARFPQNVNLGISRQSDAKASEYLTQDSLTITDPPYYDNIGYSDLSDFFYVWLRPMLRATYPDIFAGIVTPKEAETIAGPRFADPKRHFETSLQKTLNGICQYNSHELPTLVFYAYKQQQNRAQGSSSSGWERMLNTLVSAGFQIIGTWPMRTELLNRPRSLISNALASSVVLVCRKRPMGMLVATRSEFLNELESALPTALDRLTADGHIPPTDLPQAAIGPGMEIYSKYSRVETISGEQVTVREALQHINRVIGEYFDREEGELDVPSRFCLDWLKTHGYDEANFGDAENIARPKNISVEDIADTHRLIKSGQGTVQLEAITEYHPKRKYPSNDIELTVWEGCMRMAYHLDTSNEDSGGVTGCGEVGKRMSGNIDAIERLARILYNYYDNKSRPRDAYIYNQLVSEWRNILDASQGPEQGQIV